MGRRKSRSKALVTKRKLENKSRNKLPTKFDCIFCTQEKSVECEIYRDKKQGNLRCNACGEAFQTKIHSLSESIDVYTDWKDAQLAEPEHYEDEHSDGYLDSEEEGEDPLD